MKYIKHKILIPYAMLWVILNLISPATVNGQSDKYSPYYEELFRFGDAKKKIAPDLVVEGQIPSANLCQGRDGNFYGTTKRGGQNNLGTLFRMSPDGVLTTLFEFTGQAGDYPGSNPVGALIQGRDGRFYGTTSKGGSSESAGTIFAFAIDGNLKVLPENYKLLNIFKDGGARSPLAGLVEGPDGNFYGTTSDQKKDNDVTSTGTIFRITPAGSYTELVKFTGTKGLNKGSQPRAALIVDGSGNLYGTTALGGSANRGTVFKLPAKGTTVQTLAAFTATKGSYPSGELVRYGDDFYGTTFAGGNADTGTIFKIPVTGGAVTTLISFTRNGEKNKGAGPISKLTLGPEPEGFLYGTTAGGGIYDSGTIYKFPLSLTALDKSIVTLIHFSDNGNTNKGSIPVSGLILGRDGNFYGNTQQGGEYDKGTIFRVNRNAELSTLVEFNDNQSPPEGGSPIAGLSIGQDGNLYGTTSGDATDYGTFFKLTNLDGILFTLGAFNPIDVRPYSKFLGRNPSAALVKDNAGNFYGTTASGGSQNLKGTIFKLIKKQNFWEQTLPIIFTGKDGNTQGSAPRCKLLLVNDTWLYGTTSGGGNYDLGTIFKVKTDLTGFKTLVHFSGNKISNKGSDPSELVMAADGSFYGTTSGGGILNQGTIFKFNETATPPLMTLVHFGASNDARGRIPRSGLVNKKDGFFYGTTSAGGNNDCGTVFKVAPNGIIKTLVDFTDNGDKDMGKAPIATLTWNEKSSFCYGTTSEGGAFGNGTVFRVDTGGGVASDNILSTLVQFTDNDPINPGKAPLASLVWLPQTKSYYGTTSAGGRYGLGTVFKISSSGILNTLVEFAGDGTVNKGISPTGGIIYDQSSKFYYGSTKTGGSYGFGTIFKMTAGGAVTTLVNFTGNGQTNKGSKPFGKLVSDNSGNNFYGTTSEGGAFNLGTVFKMTADGELITLHEFNGDTGATPYAGLVLAKDGYLYGHTHLGGNKASGTIFKITTTGEFTSLYHFGNTTDSGILPTSNLVIDKNQNIFGTTSSGGNSNSGSGTLFKISAQSIAANKIQLKTLINFTGSGGEYPGKNPKALLLDENSSSKYLYGITYKGGVNDKGTIFKINLQVAPLDWKSISLSNVSNGINPNGGLLKNSDGFIYGSTESGGASGYGTLFKIDTLHNDKLSNVIEFSTQESSRPNSAMIVGNGGNIYGTTAGPSGSVFRLTFPGAPLISDPTAKPQNSESAIVQVKVNPRGGATMVTVKYGTDGKHFGPATLVAQNLEGYQTMVVGTTLDSLKPNTLYYIRFTAARGSESSNSPIIGFRTPAADDISDYLSGQADAVDLTGTLQVNLTGVDETKVAAIAGWRFYGERDRSWRKSGVLLQGLDLNDNRYIEFRPVPGYKTPLPVKINFSNSSNDPLIISQEYQLYNNSLPTGSLKVKLIDSQKKILETARWRFLGEDDTKWKASGAERKSLILGDYIIEFKPISNKLTPSIKTIFVGGRGIVGEVTYTDPVNSNKKVPIPLAATNFAEAPYSYIGQILTNTGSGSGFVIKKHVVATAAHVVFDDVTLSYATDVQWHFQRFKNVSEPHPLTPVGFYLFGDYAAQRRIENTPDQSTAESYTRDVAALYFNDPAGRGAFSGYLASDSRVFNEYLNNPNFNKTLVGYPIDGTEIANQDVPHGTQPDPGSCKQREFYPYLYESTIVYGLGGMSGGPLCVQVEVNDPDTDTSKQVYYPAAIYLGKNQGSAIFRSITSDIVDLFSRAEISSITGENDIDGGITQTSFSGNLNPLLKGAVKVVMKPASVALDGRWGLRFKATGEIISPTVAKSGETNYSLNAGNYILTTNAIDGYKLPKDTTIKVKGGQTTLIVYTYVPLPSTLVQSVGEETGFASATTTYTQSIGSRLPSWYDLINKDRIEKSLEIERFIVQSSDGKKYKGISVKGPRLDLNFRVEVSSNLLDWYSGNKHTTTVLDTATYLKVRDNTSFAPDRNRFIRFKVNSD